MERLSKKHKTINYFRYVDDILIIFDPNHSDIQSILADFNTVQPNLQFTAEMEENKTINYLDITIHRTHSNWNVAIYRKQKCATFTYIGKETTYIPNLFRRTDINVAFRTNNTNYNGLSPTHHTTDKYEYTQSGVYKLTCPDCNKTYVGQTGRSFPARYKENKRAFRHNSHTLKFAQHMNEYAHSFGTIHDTMQILQYHKKSTHLNTIERYYIHSEFAANNHLNDSQNIFLNPIFEDILNTHLLTYLLHGAESFLRS